MILVAQTPGIWRKLSTVGQRFDYLLEGLAMVTEKFTEKLRISSYPLYLSDIGASIGFRLAVMHPERVTATIVQNGGAHVEAFNKEFATGLFAYWEDRSKKKKFLRWRVLNSSKESQRRAPSFRHGPFRVGRRSGSDWVVDARVSRPNNTAGCRGGVKNWWCRHSRCVPPQPSIEVRIFVRMNSFVTFHFMTYRLDLLEVAAVGPLRTFVRWNPTTPTHIASFLYGLPLSLGAGIRESDREPMRPKLSFWNACRNATDATPK